jgi:pimeloyl-ACP methyl ester carboxylesterase
MKAATIFFFLSLTTSGYVMSQTSQNMQSLKMQYKVTGDGNPIVLVPGGLTGWVSWDGFVPHFAQSGKVIQVQLLNVQYGLESKLLPADYSVSVESNALAGTLDELNIATKADFIGWSYGGLVLLDYALNHPDKIRTLTLIEPPAIWAIEDSIDTEPLRYVKIFLSASPGIHSTITEEDMEKFLEFAGFASEGVPVRSLPQWNSWLNFRQSLRCNSIVLKHKDNLQRLKNFQPPVLLVKGTNSALFLHRIIDRMAQEFSSVKVVEFPGGHAPHLVSRDKFLEAFKSFR